MGISNKHSAFATIISWLLCALFILQVANRTVYYHSHITADGTVVYHAHPYNKTSDSAPYKKHKHSESEFALLAQLEVLLLLAFGLFVLYSVFRNQTYLKKAIQQYSSGYISQKPGRSPPIVSYN